jgi:hypothetical protein
MIPLRGSTLVSGLVLVLALNAGGVARAQFGVAGAVGPGWGDLYGLGYGNAVGYGFSPYGYGFYGGMGYGYGGGGYGGGFVGFPMPGFDQSMGLVPQTVTAFPGLSYGVTAVPGWDGTTWSPPRQRVRRRR